MDDIDFFSVISDIVVSERNMLSVLQRHLKVQLNGKNIFSKNKDIDKLTKRMPLITTTDPMFEIEEENKKETIGIDTYDICDLIRFDLDRYLETMVSADELFLASATYPHFQYPTKSSNQGVYAMTGSDHGQGTAKALLHINLGTSGIRRLAYQPIFQTIKIPFGQIK